MTEERKGQQEGVEECDHRKGDSHSRQVDGLGTLRGRLGQTGLNWGGGAGTQ